MRLLDDFVGSQQQRLRDRQAKCLRSFEVDHQLELRGLLDVRHHHHDKRMSIYAEAPSRCDTVLLTVQRERPRARSAAMGTSMGVAGGSLAELNYADGRDRDQAHSLRRTGIVNVNVEPTPTLLFTQILPPCSSTNFRHKVSPSPVPSIFFAAVPTCRNSSKTFS